MIGRPLSRIPKGSNPSFLTSTVWF
jgi:hypothetical protein